MKALVFLQAYLLVLLSGFIATAAGGVNKISVTVTHDLDIARPGETIVVPWADIASRLSGVSKDHLAVKDALGKLVPAQATTAFEHGNGKGDADELIFQHDFAAGEKSATFTFENTAESVPPFPTKVFARHVPERLDDFAWENDRIAHRIYGPALATPAGGKEQMVSSGIDVWCKRGRDPIINRWYAKGHYHDDTGEGLDLYEVGKSRGCGGTGIWDGQKLHVSRNWKGWKVLANGPVRTVFELSYEPWDAGGVKVSETKRFTIDAGNNLHQVDSTFTFQNEKSELTAAIGIAKHKKNIQSTDPVTTNEKAGWLSQWERYLKSGQLGTAALVGTGMVAGFGEDETNHLLLIKVRSGIPVRYYIGAGWNQSGDFPDKAAWERYLSDYSERLKSPVRISFQPEY